MRCYGRVPALSDFDHNLTIYSLRHILNPPLPSPRLVADSLPLPDRASPYSPGNNIPPPFSLIVFRVLDIFRTVIQHLGTN